MTQPAPGTTISLSASISPNERPQSTFHTRDLRKQAYASRVAEDMGTADLGAVPTTPTFFVNGQRHYGGYGIDSPTEAVRTARAAAAIAG